MLNEKNMELFSVPGNKVSVRKFMANLSKDSEQSNDICSMCTILIEYNDSDMYCQYSISKFKIDLMTILKGTINFRETSRLLFILLSFIREISLRAPSLGEQENNFNEILAKFNPPDAVTYLLERDKRQIRHINFEYPLEIQNEILNSETLKELNRITEKLSALDRQQAERISFYNDEKEHLETLADHVKGIKQKMNFAGLTHGFREIETKKNKERLKLVRHIAKTQSVMIAIPLIVMIYYFCYPNSTPDSLLDFAIHSVPIITIELMLIYLFRILLQQYSNVKTILLQVELRKNICQFIESYAEYAKKIKSNDGPALDKFEALIFGGLISNQDQLPSNFDGIEQMAKLLGALKKTPGS